MSDKPKRAFVLSGGCGGSAAHTASCCADQPHGDPAHAHGKTFEKGSHAPAAGKHHDHNVDQPRKNNN